MDSNRKSTPKKHVKHVTVRGGPPRPMPWYEDLVGRVLGRGLVWLSVRAARRNDWHEFNHLTMCLISGNSDHHAGGTCGLPAEAYHRPLRFLHDRVGVMPAGGDDDD